MYQTVSKGLIIGLILGLVFGFLGGYSYKSLNAEAPVTTETIQTSTSLAKTDTEVVSRTLAAAIAGDVVRGNYGKSLTSIFPLSTNLRTLLFPTAKAQVTEVCSDPGTVTSSIQTALSSLFGSFEDGCREAKIKGSVTIDVYGDIVKGDFYVAVTFNAKVTITELKPDCSGTTVTYTGDLSAKPIYVHVSKGGNEIVPGIPPGLPLLCTLTLSIDKTFGKIDKTRCPYCKKIIPPPSGAGSVE